MHEITVKGKCMGNDHFGEKKKKASECIIWGREEKLVTECVYFVQRTMYSAAWLSATVVGATVVGVANMFLSRVLDFFPSESVFASTLTYIFGPQRILGDIKHLVNCSRKTSSSNSNRRRSSGSNNKKRNLEKCVVVVISYRVRLAVSDWYQLCQSNLV